MQNQEYYQIFERDHPIIGAYFPTKKEAQNHLKKIALDIDSANKTPILFSTYERRLSYLPIRDILFLKKIYADGHEESVSLVIRTIKTVAQYNNF
ncbi:MAG TPA: hypothetical protein VLG36_03930 [Candidatus Chromulinivoraceae bacterium]|nr:hypothetical protein [Candidatus Chromulinivoraceae bacterium]